MTESKLQPLLITTVTAGNWTPNILPNATMSKIILQHVYQDYKCNPHQFTWNDHDCIELGDTDQNLFSPTTKKLWAQKLNVVKRYLKIFVRKYFKVVSNIHEFKISCLYLQFSWHTCEVMELGQVSPLEVNGTGNLPIQIDSTCFMLKKKRQNFQIDHIQHMYWVSTAPMCTFYMFVPVL